MLAVMVAAGMLAGEEVVEMPEVGMPAAAAAVEIAEVDMLEAVEVEVTSVVGMREVAVCPCGRHVQSTAWVDRVAGTARVEDRMAGLHDPSKTRSQSVKFL